MWLTFSERLNASMTTYGFTIGYNVCHLRRLFRVFKQLLKLFKNFSIPVHPCIPVNFFFCFSQEKSFNQHFFGVLACGGGDLFSGEHTGDLLDLFAVV